MFDQGQGITPEMIVRHDDGLTYRVDNLIHSTDGYESNHTLSGVVRVIYTQLEAGDFPAGTQWDKNGDEFRQFFTPVNPEV